MKDVATSEYATLLTELKSRIRQAQYQALRAVNVELVQLYWEIGEAIHRQQESLGWGKSVVETLASDLQAEFPGRNGFSAQDLWFMRQFYAEYRERPILQSLIRETGNNKGVRLAKPTGATARSSRSAQTRNRSAGSFTPLRPRSGC